MATVDPLIYAPGQYYPWGNIIKLQKVSARCGALKRFSLANRLSLHQRGIKNENNKFNI